MSDSSRTRTPSAARFTRSAEGVIADHQSGFEWFALSSARNFDELTLERGDWPAGEGWRLPTRAELQTLVTAGRNADGLRLDRAFEGLAHMEKVWTDDWGATVAVVYSFDFARGKPVEDWTHPTHHLGVLLLRAPR